MMKMILNSRNINDKEEEEICSSPLTFSGGHGMGNDSRTDFFNYNDLHLNRKVFTKLSEFIKEQAGINITESKKVMLESRIKKRLRALKLTSFEQYCEYLFSPEGTDRELVMMIDVVTTNKTDFFREPGHFDYLTNILLPKMIAKLKGRARKRVNIWSAGCSTGEEVYTLAMLMHEFIEKHPHISYHVFGSDIDTNVLNTAARAVYNELDADPIPFELKKKYLLKSKDRSRRDVKVRRKIRYHVSFDRINLRERSQFPDVKFDIIFCRNVVIYFDKVVRETVLSNLYNQLLPGGYLFLGHSESLLGTSLKMEQMAPTTYLK